MICRNIFGNRNKKCVVRDFSVFEFVMSQCGIMGYIPKMIDNKGS